MTRDEHLEWCKQRALEYVDADDLVSAVASMGSDLAKHPELGCTSLHLLMAGAMDAQSGDREKVRRWIAGFR